MINEKQAKKYCRDDLSKIENYEQAIADTTRTWHLHHRNAILFGLNVNERKANGMTKFDCCIMNPPYSQPSAGIPNNIEFDIISTLWKYVDGEIVALFPVNKNNLMNFKFKEFLKTIDTHDDYGKYFKCDPRKTISINVFDTKK